MAITVAAACYVFGKGIQVDTRLEGHPKIHGLLGRALPLLLLLLLLLLLGKLRGREEKKGIHWTKKRGKIP